jgi:peptidoglycan/xylan/chitin deacetylase (PgdA/CDA1 family)
VKCAIAALLLPLAACAQAPTREIAITLDDVPLVGYYTYPDDWQRYQAVDSMTAALARHNAPFTVFAIGQDAATPHGRALLDRWLDAGAALGNHTFSHPDMGTLPVDQGIAEIERGGDVLRPIADVRGLDVRFFRFPFLAEGVSAEQKRAYADALGRLGLYNARVSVSNDDWAYNERYRQAELEERWEDRYEIGQEYVRHMLESVRYWDAVGLELAGRPVRHVLLLHANRINRDYLGAILDSLAADGYAFVDLERAYADPIWDEADTWTSADGVSFLEHLRQSRRAEGP